jgi:nitrate reductase gamma subunit
MQDYEDQRRRQAAKWRSAMDYSIGSIIILLGIYFLIYRKLGVNIFKRQPTDMDYLIGVLLLAYGGWRIYRGYKKTYFR